MNEERGSRYEFLDALRGVAILAVMLLHFGARGRAADDQLVHARLWPFVSHGYLGVQLFFVLSGYCITAAMQSAARNPMRFRVFIQRRLRRILPPYWWSLLLTVAMSTISCFVMHKGWFEIVPLTACDWAINICLLQEPLHAPSANVVYWSLSIEIQFYLVMTLCLLKVDWTEYFLVVMSLISMLYRAFPVFPSFYGTILALWPQFVCGIGAYYLITGRNRFVLTPWCLLGTVVATILLSWRHEPGIWLPDGRFTFPAKVIFCIVIALVIVVLHPFDARLMRGRCVRWLAALGCISYTLYLIHEPIGTRIFNLGERFTGLEQLWWLAYVGVAFACTFAIGMPFFVYCERPWLSQRGATR